MHDRPRPDPQLGVFETLLVVDGRPVELEGHLARLEASLDELFPDRTHPDLTEMDVPVVSRPYGRLTTGTSELSSLRLTVAPDDGANLSAKVETRDVPGTFLPHSGKKVPPTETFLRSLPLAGGLGAHKWADRSWLDEAQAGLPAGALPLIVDADGAVLEASRANVFAVRHGALFTPPLDGRILPGVTRSRVLEIAATDGLETHEAKLSHDDLLAADEVFLTGSIRGIEPVQALDGVPVAQGGEVAARLTAELRKAWLGALVG